MSVDAGNDKKRKIVDGASLDGGDGTVSAAAFDALQRKLEEIEAELLSTKQKLLDTTEALQDTKKKLETANDCIKDSKATRTRQSTMTTVTLRRFQKIRKEFGMTCFYSYDPIAF